MVTADFAGINNVEFYNDLANNKCGDIDVSIVIANAGVMIVGDYENFPGSAL